MKSRCDETINMVKFNVYPCMLEDNCAMSCLHFVPLFYISYIKMIVNEETNVVCKKGHITSSSSTSYELRGM